MVRSTHAWVRNRAKNLPEIGDQQSIDIIISGLRKEIREAVLTAKHDAIDDVKKTARIFEIAERESSDGITTIANLEKTIVVLVDELDQKLTCSPDNSRREMPIEQPSSYSAIGDWMLDRTENRVQAPRDQMPRRNESRPTYRNRFSTPVRQAQWQQSTPHYMPMRFNSPYRQQSQQQYRRLAGSNTQATSIRPTATSSFSYIPVLLRPSSHSYLLS